MARCNTVMLSAESRAHGVDVGGGSTTCRTAHARAAGTPPGPGRHLHLVEYLRHEPCAVAAWWIAADVDAVVRLSADSMTVLHRAVADLRRRAGWRCAVANHILRALDLTEPAEPRTAKDARAWAAPAA